MAGKPSPRITYGAFDMEMTHEDSAWLNQMAKTMIRNRLKNAEITELLIDEYYSATGKVLSKHAMVSRVKRIRRDLIYRKNAYAFKKGTQQKDNIEKYIRIDEKRQATAKASGGYSACKRTAQ